MKKLIITMWMAILISNIAISQIMQAQKEILLDPFTRLECSGGNLYVKLVPSDQEKTIITGATLKQIRSINITQENDLLIVHKNSVKHKKGSVTVTVYYKEIGFIECGGAVNITAKSAIKGQSINLEAKGASDVDLLLDVEHLKTDISGASDVTLRGKATRHELEISGASDLKAKQLKTHITIFDASGSSDGTIHADIIEGETTGVSSIDYNDSAQKVDINGLKKREKSKGNTFEESSVYIIHKNRNDSTLVEFSDYINHISDTISNDYAIRIIKDGINIYISNPENDKDEINIEWDEEGNNDYENEERGRGIFIDEHGLSIKGMKDIFFKKRKRFEGHWSGLSLGVNGMINPEGQFTFPSKYEKMELKYQKSINVSLNILEYEVRLINNNFGLVTGLGFMWDNYRFDNNVILFQGENELGFKDPDPNKTYKKSKLSVTYLNVPLLMELQGGKNSRLYISAGVVGGLRIGTHTKIKYSNGNKEKDRNDFFMNPLRADLMVRMGLGRFNIYGSYGLIPLFRDNKGPKMYPFNVGIHLNM